MTTRDNHDLFQYNANSFIFVDWFSQQNEFCTDIEEMEKGELNKCLRNFLRVIDQHLRKETHNKPFSIIGCTEFTEANKSLNPS